MRKTTLITLTLTLAAGLLAGLPAAHASSPPTTRKMITLARAAQKAWPCAPANSPTARKLIQAARAAQETAAGWKLVSAGERASARLAQEAPASTTPH